LRDIPNKILVYTSHEPKILARKVKEAIDNRVMEFWEEALRYIKHNMPFDSKEAKRQIEDLVEYVWAAVVYDRQRDDYYKERRLLEALMASRKNTRDFAAVAWAVISQILN